MSRRRAGYIIGVALGASLCAPIAIVGQAPATRDLTRISLEDLMNVEVISVARKEQKLSETPAAVFVIAHIDIERSGAANIPDLLRMVPGVNVARIDANTWAISIRGFNSLYSDKILVLIDGRSVYSPGFAGVNWDQIDVPLEDIERIEVIRGSGGTVWGANAMNGVINIITMSSAATQGGTVVAEAGSQVSGGLVQYGGKAGGAGTWRAFGKYSNTDSAMNPAGDAAADGWHAFHGGFRADLTASPRDTLMLQGDSFQSGEGQTLTTVLAEHLPAVATLNDPITVNNEDLQGRWSHILRNGSEMTLNVYYNHINRLDQGVLENSNSFDADFQHHIAINTRNDVVWGLGYRITDDNLSTGYAVQFNPPERTDNLYSFFVQDQVKLANSASFTIGSKLEHNAYTGFEYEPSAQFAWTPTSRQIIWLSASQAIRQPSPQDTDVQFDVAVVPLQGGNFGVVEYLGNKNIQAEQLRNYEVGYRAQATKRLSLGVAAFRGYYRHLEEPEAEASYSVDTPGPPHLILPEYLEDDGHARTFGGEVYASWNVTDRWLLSPGYSLLRMSVTDVLTTLGYTPEHQAQLRSTLRMRSNLDWDTSLYFVGQLSGAQVPAYTRLDVQLRWRIRESVEFSVTGQNLLTARHAEFSDTLGVDHTQVLRAVIGKIIWRF